ncbi:MAG: DUF1292 domain-containing protein [Clostridiales bacterium]|nr:DUF1292 domain-containing protein [Clostridiales bacterium]
MADYDKKLSDNDQMTLYLDDGSELVCDVISVFNCNERDYIALLPADADEDADVYLYRFIMEDDDFDNITLENIEDDEEFEEVCEVFENQINLDDILDED